MARFQADVRFKARLQRVVEDLQEAGYTVRVNSVYRSNAQQQRLIDLWDEGDSSVVAQPAPVGQSAHNYGMAADLNLDPPDYDVLGQVAENNGLVQPDPEGDEVHIELPDWRELKRGWTASGRLVEL